MPAYDDDNFRDLPLDDERDSRSGRGNSRHDSWDDDDGPDPRDLVPDDIPTVRCRSCKKLIFETLARCPYCGHMQLESDHHQRSTWFIVTVILCIAVMGGFTTLYLLGLIPWPIR